MRRLTSIVAVNPKGVIGLGNELPWRVKSDLRFFKAQTSGNVIIMGRKTHDSLGQCLPNRHNVVVSHQFSLFQATENCVLQHSIADSLIAAESAPASFKEAFVIGGASMYRQFSNIVDRYLVTIIDKDVPDGDAYFDQDIIGDTKNWDIKTISSGRANEAGDECDFTIFEMLARDPDRRRTERAAIIASAEERILHNRRGHWGKKLAVRRNKEAHPSLI
jgi:dihydrofolate reductase